jgi:hypothetical protein
MANTSGRLRIDFQVREILPDGQDPSDARYVTFGDEVDFGAVKEFFERCGIAADLMFHGRQTAKVIQLKVRTNRKIDVIKSVRALTGLGLKEAKDVVEDCDRLQSLGMRKGLVLFEDGRDADAAMQVFANNGIFNDVEVVGCNFTKAQAAGTPLYVKERR